MTNSSTFIAVEGLDGSGKSTISKMVVDHLNTVFKRKVKLTYEPNNSYCGGKYIRKVLEKKILDFSHEALALAFAANRKDHNDRLIDPWLEKGSDRVVITDRYYLSSLVYQSNNVFTFEDVMYINRFARKPDLILFFDVSDKTCYERMDIRNKPKELFEENFSATRTKFYKAIDFLRQTRNENILKIDANGTVEEVFGNMIGALKKIRPEWEELI